MNDIQRSRVTYLAAAEPPVTCKTPTDKVTVTVLEDDLALIPEGLYRAEFLYHETCTRFSSPKVVYWFSIAEGSEKGTKLGRWYNCKEFVGRPRRGGRFIVGRRHELFKEYYRLFPYDERGPDPERLLGKTLEIEVEIVKRGGNRKAIPRQAQYSVIRELVAVVVDE